MKIERHLLEKLNALLGAEPYGTVEDQLFKWFVFGFTGDGKGIKALSTEQYYVFKERLPELIEAVYQWHRDNV